MRSIEENEIAINNGQLTEKKFRQDNGQFAEGHPGRKPGTVNKFRKEIRDYLQKGFPEFLKWVNSLKEKDRVDAYLSLLPYGLSRLQSVSVTDTEGNDIPKARIDYSLLDLDEDTLRKVLAATQLDNDGNQ